jgi:hypothetical protein
LDIICQVGGIFLLPFPGIENALRMWNF